MPNQRTASVLLPLDLLKNVDRHVAQRGRLAVLLQPAEYAGRYFIEILHLNRRIERLKQIIADLLENLKFEFFADLIRLVAGLVLLVHAFDDLLVVAFHDAQGDHFLSKRLCRWKVDRTIESIEKSKMRLERLSRERNMITFVII